MPPDDTTSPVGSTGDGGERETYTARYDWNETDVPSSAIVQAVAAVTNTEPTAMGPLYEAVNTDAMNRLFGRRYRVRPDRLSVRFENCDVTVYADGRVTVAPRERPADRDETETEGQ